jgi:hypothetical protein
VPLALASLRAAAHGLRLPHPTPQPLPHLLHPQQPHLQRFYQHLLPQQHLCPQSQSPHQQCRPPLLQCCRHLLLQSYLRLLHLLLLPRPCLLLPQLSRLLQ